MKGMGKQIVKVIQMALITITATIEIEVVTTTEIEEISVTEMKERGIEEIVIEETTMMTIEGTEGGEETETELGEEVDINTLVLIQWTQANQVLLTTISMEEGTEMKEGVGRDNEGVRTMEVQTTAHRVKMNRRQANESWASY